MTLQSAQRPIRAAVQGPVPDVLPERRVDTQPAPARVRKTWREQRWERRRRRRYGEEILGWLLVPVILVSAYWAVKSGLNALGTSPTALVAGIKAAMSGRGG